MTASGWYPDPWRQAPLRWWDGSRWTGYVHPVPTPVPIPVLMPTPMPLQPPETANPLNRSPLAWYLASGLVVAVGLAAAALSWALGR